ncbi:MAG: PhnD/SsuA/transferrin family substrate-binding protein [Candidatus Binatia bacterium]
MADYHALIFTRNNGATKRLKDLQGKMIAFEHPESTSDYFLPKMLFSKKLVQMNRLAPKILSRRTRHKPTAARYLLRSRKGVAYR